MSGCSVFSNGSFCKLARTPPCNLPFSRNSRRFRRSVRDGPPIAGVDGRDIGHQFGELTPDFPIDRFREVPRRIELEFEIAGSPKHDLAIIGVPFRPPRFPAQDIGIGSPQPPILVCPAHSSRFRASSFAKLSRSLFCFSSVSSSPAFSRARYSWLLSSLSHAESHFVLRQTVSFSEVQFP